MENNISWAKEAVFYHIYPIGAFGCDRENNRGEVRHNILKVMDYIPHLKDMGITAVYFGPLWESGTHGYDTHDYYNLDRRLGDNADFKKVCDALHKEGIRIVLDGVFNHIGRGHVAFEEVKANRENTPYKDWISGINFGGNNWHNDGFCYDTWAGAEELVKLNLYNPEVRKHLLDAIEMWIDEFDIDGLRLDAADCIQKDFFKELRYFVKTKKNDFWLMGEIIHGDYNMWANDEMLDTVTNYECWKGIYSSHNDKSYFEITSAMKRQWGQGGIYQRTHLYNFIDNHDVNRIYSLLRDKENIYPVYTLLFTMPGIPSIYYGSEWAVEGEKNKGDVGDYPLRPEIVPSEMKDLEPSLIKHIKTLSEIKRQNPCLSYGVYEEVQVRHETLVFARSFNDEFMLTALNCTEKEMPLEFDYRGKHYSIVLEPHGSKVFN